MVIDKGSFVLISYVGRIKDTGEIFDTNLLSVAKENNLNTEGIDFSPYLVVVGEGFIFKPIEDALTGKREGDELEVEVSPEYAFGIYDPSLVRTFSLSSFEFNYKPSPGEYITIEENGRPLLGKVVYIGSGRIMIDFNNPLAGRTLVYKVKIDKEITDNNEKIIELVKKLFNYDASKIEIKENQIIIKGKPIEERSKRFESIVKNYINNQYNVIYGSDSSK
jgi:FKBP-type peptidyl-prolyl cis-trans isomerase 2